jgi:hypothetical protein
MARLRDRRHAMLVVWRSSSCQAVVTRRDRRCFMSRPNVLPCATSGGGTIRFDQGPGTLPRAARTVENGSRSVMRGRSVSAPVAANPPRTTGGIAHNSCTSTTTNARAAPAPGIAPSPLRPSWSVTSWGPRGPSGGRCSGCSSCSSSSPVAPAHEKATATVPDVAVCRAARLGDPGLRDRRLRAVIEASASTVPLQSIFADSYNDALRAIAEDLVTALDPP